MNYAKLKSAGRKLTFRYPFIKRSGLRAEMLLWKSRGLFGFDPAIVGAYSKDILAIDPNCVKYSVGAVTKGKYPYIKRGIVDNVSKYLETLDEEGEIYFLIAEHYEGQKAWEATSNYQRAIKKLQSGSEFAGCRTPDELQRQLIELDELYRRLAETSGDANFVSAGDIRWSDRISINIDRNGRMLLAQGFLHHALAKFLRLESIDARVANRHQKWESFRQEVMTYIERESGRAYQPLLHPDMRDMPSLHGDGRFELITRHLPLSRGKLLDLGANWGYFSHKFEEIGFQVVAYEISPLHTYFMRKLRDSVGNNFDIVSASFLDSPPKSEFDVVLALNIFHHFIKARSTYIKLKLFLKNLRAQYMIFEPNIAGSLQMEGAYTNFSPEEFVQFVLDSSNFTKSELIGYGEGNRPLYLLS